MLQDKLTIITPGKGIILVNPTEARSPTPSKAMHTPSKPHLTATSWPHQIRTNPGNYIQN